MLCSSCDRLIRSVCHSLESVYPIMNRRNRRNIPHSHSGWASMYELGSAPKPTTPFIGFMGHWLHPRLKLVTPTLTRCWEREPAFAQEKTKDAVKLSFNREKTKGRRVTVWEVLDRKSSANTLGELEVRLSR